MTNLKGKTVFLKENSKPGIVINSNTNSVSVKVDGEARARRVSLTDIVVFGEVQFTKK